MVLIWIVALKLAVSLQNLQRRFGHVKKITLGKFKEKTLGLRHNMIESIFYLSTVYCRLGMHDIISMLTVSDDIGLKIKYGTLACTLGSADIKYK